MKRIINILIIIVLYVVFCGKSCEDDSERISRQSQQAILARDSIRKEFETDFLAEEARCAAEVQAVQKLSDLADYVEVFADVTLDSLFREKAGEMIREMFVSEKVRLTFDPERRELARRMSVDEFLKDGFGKRILWADIRFDSVMILKSPEKSAQGYYLGKLVASQLLICHTQADSISSLYKVSIDFISSKRKKFFGTDTLNVWVVSLGDMETAR